MPAEQRDGRQLGRDRFEPGNEPGEELLGWHALQRGVEQDARRVPAEQRDVGSWGAIDSNRGMSQARSCSAGTRCSAGWSRTPGACQGRLSGSSISVGSLGGLVSFSRREGGWLTVRSARRSRTVLAPLAGLRGTPRPGKSALDALSAGAR